MGEKMELLIWQKLISKMYMKIKKSNDNKYHIKWAKSISLSFSEEDILVKIY